MTRHRDRLDYQAGQQHNALKLTLSSTKAFACLLVALVSIPTNALAEPGLFAGEGYITAGTSAGPKNLNSYQAIIYAPFGSLSETGLILRGWSKAFRFAYKTDLPAANNVTVTAMGLSFEGEAGWQFTFDQARIALYGGVVWRKHTLSPIDPGSTLARSRLGFSATIDGQYKFTPDYGVMANASFLQGFNQFWAQAKPYIKFDDGWKPALTWPPAAAKTTTIRALACSPATMNFRHGRDIAFLLAVKLA